jgi:aldehyde dehydrogenase (NAD+)
MSADGIDLAAETATLLDRLGVPSGRWRDGTLPVRSPIDGSTLAHVCVDPAADIATAIDRAHAAFPAWAAVPAPERGELVRRLGERLRHHKEDLSRLVTLEAGKILSESRGEVQEMIDMCDFAVGLSRQLYGRTMPSERPGHRLMETWHPLGVVAIISAFNFPVAVWSWNVALALIAGDPVIWKPSELTPLTALACAAILEELLREAGHPHVHRAVVCEREDAGALLDDTRIRLVSATGSTAMGREVGSRVQRRLGRVLLELGGNNAAIVMPSADLDLAVRAIVFSAVGTAGQRCTTLRRLIVHDEVADELLVRLERAYTGLPIGDPWGSHDVLVGPLHTRRGYERMRAALEVAVTDGGRVVTGGDRIDLGPGYEDAFYVRPAIVEMPRQTDIVREETFAPVLYVLRCSDLDTAIALHNDVPQGLSSSIFTRDVREAERFMGALGSDCGIVNVNIGTSGAEIGGAFGGEKETGGGRESGSDAWKSYMRRATNTINASDELPLAQGVEF